MLGKTILALVAGLATMLKALVVGICIALAYFTMLLIFGVDYQLRGGSLPLWAYIIRAHKQVVAKVNKYFGIN